MRSGPASATVYPHLRSRRSTEELAVATNSTGVRGECRPSACTVPSHGGSIAFRQVEDDPLSAVRVTVAARELLAEALAARLTKVCEARGVELLLIKGPALACWLYPSGEVRNLGDLDVVVDPGKFALAEHLLLELGFVNKYEGRAPQTSEFHADMWSHPRWLPVDLHRRLWGVGVNEH